MASSPVFKVYTGIMPEATVPRKLVAPSDRARRPTNSARRSPVTREDLLRYTDPGPEQETEEIVRFLYGLRRKSKPRGGFK